MDSTMRKYSDEEKKQLIANLNHEVEHRTHQFRSWLQDRLEAFRIHQEGHILRIPKEVRSMTMREFGEKYNGNVQAARRGVQRERLNSAEEDPTSNDLDRKRKRIPSQEDDLDATHSGGESSRATKNARLMEASPQKAGSSTGPGTAQRARMLSGTQKTPGKNRLLARIAGSPSTQKQRPPFNAGIKAPSSPSKLRDLRPPPSRSRMPSSATFAPTLPPKTPGYPGSKPPSSNGLLRMPRIDESMLSVNGSPLANPFEFGMKWAKSTAPPAAPLLKRTKSNITISRDPSFNDGFHHSHTASQPSLLVPSSQPPSSSSHSRSNSEVTASVGVSQSQPNPHHQVPLTPPPHPHSQPLPERPAVTPLPGLARSYSMTISTKDGHVLEFDPLQTSPGSLDALEGITASAKKQAREDIGRLVQAASEKWKID
ncbi:hypothetical protein BDZ89DRAFT_1098929 [Hymenopellis radicata]|nr:hypothetical protein BDZ89DRAFT_1098929 [Hymenopellis radicata]